MPIWGKAIAIFVEIFYTWKKVKEVLSIWGKRLIPLKKWLQRF